MVRIGLRPASGVKRVFRTLTAIPCPSNAHLRSLQRTRFWATCHATKCKQHADIPAGCGVLLRHLNFAPAKSPPTPDASANPAFPQILSYEIESEIGRGGMGIVYKARHTTLRRTDAVKMITSPSAHATPSEVARFLAEAEAIAAVKHQNVVQVYGLG